MEKEVAKNIEEEQVLIGNRLISEFMEDTFKRDYNIVNFLVCPVRGSIANSFYVEELEYHSSWDWLMPVIEKITELKYPIYIYQSHIQKTCEIYEMSSKYYVVRESDTIMTSLEVSWTAIVSFVEYYNENIKNKK